MYKEGLILDQFELLKKYQSVDMELEHYEREMRQSANRKELLHYRDFLLEQQAALKKIGDEVETMTDRVAALEDEVERLNTAVEAAVRNFETNRPDTEEKTEEQLAAMQKLVSTITRYESEIAKLRKDADSRDRLQKEIRVRAAKARAEFDRIKVLYDAEYKTGSAKLEELKKAVAAEEKGIDPALIEKYKSIKRHASPAITGLHNDRCGGCNMQLPAADMNKIRTGEPYVECENCGRIILVNFEA